MLSTVIMDKGKQVVGKLHVSCHCFACGVRLGFNLSNPNLATMKDKFTGHSIGKHYVCQNCLDDPKHFV